MKINKMLLIAVAMASVSASTFAVDQDLSAMQDITTYGSNNVSDSIMSAATVVGKDNSIKEPASGDTTIVGDNNSLTGAYHTVVGNLNRVEGNLSTAIGNGITLYGQRPQDPNAPIALVYPVPIVRGPGMVGVGDHAAVNYQYGSAFGYGSETQSENSVSIGAFSFAGDAHAVDSKYAGVANNRGVLAIGREDGPFTLTYGPHAMQKEDWSNDFTRQIQHVSAGQISKTSTDAINGSQLNDAFERIDINKKNIKDLAVGVSMLGDAVKENTDDITELNSKVDENQQEVRKGIASASALAALHPLDFDPDHKVDVMSGVGNYRGNTAVALGVAYRPHENLMFTIASSINGKDTAINAGVSYKVGANTNSAYTKAGTLKHINELNATVEQQNAKIEQQNVKIEQLNSLVEKLLTEVHSK